MEDVDSQSKSAQGKWARKDVLIFVIVLVIVVIISGFVALRLLPVSNGRNSGGNTSNLQAICPRGEDFSICDICVSTPAPSEVFCCKPLWKNTTGQSAFGECSRLKVVYNDTNTTYYFRQYGLG